MRSRNLLNDENGSVLVEATVMMVILFTFVLGSIDFLFAFYQWNAAAKAVQLGARIAAVSDPVAQGLNNLSANVVSDTVLPGSQMPAFTVTCSGSATTCSCTGTCTGLGASPTLNQTALKTIVYGRGNSGTCNNNPNGIYFAGMCNMFPGLAPAGVKIVYSQPDPALVKGMGFAGRPDGPVPTVEVSLQNVNFRYYFLNGLMGFGPKLVPPSSAAPTTTTGEVLSSCAQNLSGQIVANGCGGF
jgi:TadE-like protein